MALIQGSLEWHVEHSTHVYATGKPPSVKQTAQNSNGFSQIIAGIIPACLLQERLSRCLNTLETVLREWADYYLEMAVTGIRSEAVTHKIRFHLARFQAFFEERYGQEHISSLVKRDVIAWREHLRSAGLAASTINNHMASLSGFATWVQAQDATAFVMGDPIKGIGDLPLPPLEPRALDEDQVRSLKNLCDRLFPFYRLKNRRWLQSDREAPLRARARPWRDRAMVFVLLSTGLRREELVRLNISQLSPSWRRGIATG